MHNGNREDTLRYRDLSDGLKERIARDRENRWVNPFRFDDDAAVRRSDMPKDRANIWRPVFVRDTEKILHLPVYNRYADKTQVFSFYHNDDITRRALHVQLVSRISRNIGAVLGLNLELIEAISLGHDLGHTPFGHAGERYLSHCIRTAADAILTTMSTASGSLTSCFAGT
jgi:dGTPase